MPFTVPPSQLDGAEVLLYASLEGLIPTGTHYIVTEDSERIYPPNVAICQYAGAEGFYRFYCDKQWEVITDVDHASIEEAMQEIEAGYPDARERFKSLPRLC